MQKLICCREDLFGEINKKIIRFKCKIALIVNLGKSLSDFLPVEIKEIRRTMPVLKVVIVMDVQTADIIVTESSEHFGSRCSDKTCVSYIDASGKISRIKHIHHGFELLADAANIRNNTMSAAIPAEHILTCDFYIIFLAKRNKIIVKLGIKLKISLAVFAVICRMNYNIFRSESTCDFY